MENTNQLKAPITDLNFIKKLLPHREPMIMVDALLFYNSKKGVSNLIISDENIFVENGNLSETGVMEHMAQTAALHIGYKFYANKAPVKEGFIASIKSSKIFTLPNVNDAIITEATIAYEAAGMTMVKFVSKVNSKIMATAEMNTILKS